jgi:hypothetical protein
MSALQASVRVCQSSAPSFGRVDSSMKVARRPQWTAQASGRFRRMLEENAASSPTRTKSSSANSSNILCHSVMESKRDLNSSQAICSTDRGLPMKGPPMGGPLGGPFRLPVDSPGVWPFSSHPASRMQTSCSGTQTKRSQNFSD